jgi:hypothetical protein
VRVSPSFGSLLLVSFLVSFANEIAHGRYSVPALACLTVALGVLARRFVLDLRAPSLEAGAPRTLSLGLLWTALASMPVIALLDPKLIAYPHTTLVVLRALQVGSLLLLVTYLPLLKSRLEPRFIRRARFVLFGALTLVTGLAVIRISPAPAIDVWDLQMRGAFALLRGENPYVTVTAPITCPEWATKGIMDNPYVYAPGALYVGVFGLLVGKDVRYAMLLAILVTGAALRAIPRRRVSDNALPSLVEDSPALLVWLMPSLFFVLEMAWLDPVQLMCVCIAVAAYLRLRPILCAAAIGFALASKQSMFWLLPIAGFVLHFRLRDWIVAGATCTVLVAPFVIGDIGALKHAVFDFPRMLPPRDDALGAAVWFKHTFGWTLPVGLAFVTAAAVAGVAVVRARSLSPSGQAEQRALLFSCAATLAYFSFFFFNKWAFANYYFFVAGLAALAAATALHEHEP